MVVGGVHGCGGHVWLRGACMVMGGMHGCGGDLHSIRQDMVNERVVHILLECILVEFEFRI